MKPNSIYISTRTELSSAEPGAIVNILGLKPGLYLGEFVVNIGGSYCSTHKCGAYYQQVPAIIYPRDNGSIEHELLWSLRPPEETGGLLERDYEDKFVYFIEQIPPGHKLAGRFAALVLGTASFEEIPPANERHAAFEQILQENGLHRS